ncbi:Rhamnogalacturonate lyase family protein [Forsythia ovata]|uniref:Rhamnogalacturonate lyase family protein n=1 Tax=Forsythia ovata TaxID=205694 RepID=A0ABD1U730_9LAMI
MDNGFVNLTLLSPSGMIVGIQYKEIKNILEYRFKESRRRFHYMVISDDRQRMMPIDHDRITGRALEYKEAILLTNPHSPTFKHEVDDKYQYSCNNKDNLVHGWISTNPRIGFWIITPSYEFRAGGPIKPDLTSHVGPTSLAPYDFPLSKDFSHANRRGVISGRVLVFDKYNNKELMPAKSAYVGLAAPGNLGSWQEETKGYQFWTQTDEMGYFTIRNVRASTYNLNA